MPSDIETEERQLLPLPPRGNFRVEISPETGGSSLHLTERQLVWVAHRLSQADDLYACAASGVEPDEVIEWRNDPDFSAFLERSLRDKSGNFRPLTENLLPIATRTLYDLLANGNNRERQRALSQLMKIHGFEVQTVRKEDPEAIQDLLSRLRQPVPVEVVDIEPRA